MQCSLLKSLVFRAILVETKGVTSKMKRIIVLMILACVLFISTGIAEDSEKFVFRNGITWGMSPEEVQACEDETLLSADTPDTTLYIPEVDVSQYVARLHYYFKKNQLYMCEYYFTKYLRETVTVKDYLTGALNSKYANGEQDIPEILYCLFQQIDPEFCLSTIPDGSVYHFTTTDGTDVILTCFGKSSPISIIYINESLFQELFDIYNTDGL